MARFWTKKKEDDDEKTIAAVDFMERLAKSKRTPEEEAEQPKIENTNK